jgi:hypothetical protein
VIAADYVDDDGKVWFIQNKRLVSWPHQDVLLSTLLISLLLFNSVPGYLVISKMVCHYGGHRHIFPVILFNSNRCDLFVKVH